MSDIAECLRNDLDLLAHIVPSQVRTARRVGISWKAWLQIFTPEIFVANLLRMLIDTADILSNTIEPKSMFHAAACLLHWISDHDESLIQRMIAIALDIVENDYPGSDFAGEGLAAFCLLLSVGLIQEWEKVFQELLAFRDRLASQNPPTGTTQRAFCVHIITISLYIGHLHSKIRPEVFTAPLMQMEWQATIDYFIARASPELSDPE
jgi:hypothetical protein